MWQSPATWFNTEAPALAGLVVQHEFSQLATTQSLPVAGQSSAEAHAVPEQVGPASGVPLSAVPESGLPGLAAGPHPAEVKATSVAVARADATDAARGRRAAT